ncbi:MAG: hypothetical protein KDJ65_32520 [Anaerolineae bacterium]|nr:hypothetical protein [Anaerolineae bacterium]
MDYSKRRYYQALFENACHKKKMNAFQDFFNDIMETRYPGDFIRVRPWGRYGDRKNDGFLKSKGTLFQVYAPKNLESKKAAQKISEDFEGALKHWNDDLKQWVFVHNDHDGLGPEGTAQVLYLEKTYPQVDIEIWSPQILQNELFALDEKDIAFLLQVPTLTFKEMMQVGYQDLKVVIEDIAHKIPPTQQEIKPVPSDKVQINQLSDDVKSRLNLGAQGSPLVGDFFEKWTDPELGDKIAEAFRQEYSHLKSQNLAPDDIFWALLIFAGGTHRGPSVRHESAVLAVLSYFFERCDIFEPSPGLNK